MVPDAPDTESRGVLGFFAAFWDRQPPERQRFLRFAVVGASGVLVNFAFLPHYPFWSILIIALDIWVIWALTRPGAVRT